MGRERERYSRVSPGDKAPAGGVEDAAAASQGEGRLIRHLRLRYGNWQPESRVGRGRDRKPGYKWKRGGWHLRRWKVQQLWHDIFLKANLAPALWWLCCFAPQSFHNNDCIQWHLKIHMIHVILQTETDANSLVFHLITFHNIELSHLRLPIFTCLCLHFRIMGYVGSVVNLRWLHSLELWEMFAPW